VALNKQRLMPTKKVQEKKDDMKDIEKQQRLMELEDTRQRLIIDKLYALKGILSGAMIDGEKSSFGSDPHYKPLIEEYNDIEEIRGKIMGLIKQC
jgi:hypothetical protein